MIIISACLCGINCKYNGGCNANEKIMELVRSGTALPICPEQLGGLSTPRLPSEIVGGSAGDVLDGKADVKNSIGEVVTENFIKGAVEALKLAQNINAEYAVLKAKSPSCGFGKVYDGSFNNKLIDGNGITAELLIRKGIKVKTEQDL